MNIYELEKQATPGPWKCVDGEETWELHGDGGVVGHTYGLHEDFALAAHCRNNFMRALEALKKTQDLYAGLVLGMKLRNNPTKSGIYEYELDVRSGANVKLIAELEEVK